MICQSNQCEIRKKSLNRKKAGVDSQIFGYLFDLILGVGNWGLGIDV